jgi:hypothetical protein
MNYISLPFSSLALEITLQSETEASELSSVLAATIVDRITSLRPTDPLPAVYFRLISLLDRQVKSKASIQLFRVLSTNNLSAVMDLRKSYHEGLRTILPSLFCRRLKVLYADHHYLHRPSGNHEPC